METADMIELNGNEYRLYGRDDVVAGITSLVSNYPPEDNKYTESEIRTFLEIVVFEQLALRFMPFVKSYVDAGETIHIDAFPSLKMSLFTVFYKFYVDNRCPSRSDAFDIIISAPTPYVDAIITERHQAEVIRKIKQRDDFVSHVTPYILRDFRSSLMSTGPNNLVNRSGESGGIRIQSISSPPGYARRYLHPN